MTLTPFIRAIKSCFFLCTVWAPFILRSLAFRQGSFCGKKGNNFTRSNRWRGSGERRGSRRGWRSWRTCCWAGSSWRKPWTPGPRRRLNLKRKVNKFVWENYFMANKGPLLCWQTKVWNASELRLQYSQTQRSFLAIPLPQTFGKSVPFVVIFQESELV